MHADAVFFHNPKRTNEGFLREQLQYPPDGCFDCGMRLVAQAKNDNAAESGRRIGEDVGKIKIQGDERALFAAADLNNSLIRLATQGLLDDRVSVVTCGGENGR